MMVILANYLYNEKHHTKIEYINVLIQFSFRVLVSGLIGSVSAYSQQKHLTCEIMPNQNYPNHLIHSHCVQPMIGNYRSIGLTCRISPVRKAIPA